MSSSRRIVSAVPVRRSVENVSGAPLACRSGLAETIGMNEAALGAGLWGRNPHVVANRWICAASVPRALTEGVPHVDVNPYDDVRRRIGKTLHGK